MPKGLVDVSTVVIAAFLGLLVLSGLLSWLWEGFRTFLLHRVIGSVVRNVMAPLREDERQRQLDDSRAERVRKAIDDLSGGLAMASSTDTVLSLRVESGEKIQKAVSVLRIECPELKEQLDRAARGARPQPPDAVRQLIDPIIEGTRDIVQRPYRDARVSRRSDAPRPSE